MLDVQRILVVFIIAVVVVHVSLSFRELLGLGGKQDREPKFPA